MVAVAHTASIIAFCWFAAHAIVAVIDATAFEHLAQLLLLTLAALATRSVTGALLDALAVRGAAVVKSQLRSRALAAIDAGGSAVLGRSSSGRITTLLGHGLDALDGYIGRYVPQLILTAVATPLVVGALLLADVTTGITVILTLPIIPVFMVLIGLATQAVQQRQWALLGSLASGFLEVVQGLSTLMIFGRQHRQAERIAAITEQYRRRTMRVLRLSFLSGFTLELAASLSVALVAVSIGVRLIDGDIAFALGLFVLILVPEAYLPLRQVGAQFHAAAEGLAAAHDVLDLVEGAPTHPGLSAVAASSSAGRHERHLGSDSAVDHEADTGAAIPALEVKQLTVRRGDTVVVDGLSGSWMPGTVLAVTGPSGAGKSSFLGALLGLVEHDGEVLLDGVAVPPAERMASIAWAGQRPELTSGPLEQVVALGSEHPDAALARAALAWAAVDDVPATAVLGPAGEGLSGGQAQRVALARARYRAVERGTRIVLLDEPSSALDAATESRIAAAVRELADEGRLVVVVTHRHALREAADAVLELDRAVAPPSTVEARS